MMLFPWGDASRIERGTDSGVLHSSQPLPVTPASHLSNLPGSCAQEIWYMPPVPSSRHLGLCLGSVQPDATPTPHQPMPGQPSAELKEQTHRGCTLASPTARLAWNPRAHRDLDVGVRERAALWRCCVGQRVAQLPAVSRHLRRGSSAVTT